MNHENQIIGVEALLHWRHPQHGLVVPDIFIPLAEETDLILSIGRWVLETACAQIKAWSGEAATRHLRLAVNVSSREFCQPDFVTEVKQVLADAGADPTRLKRAYQGFLFSRPAPLAEFEEFLRQHTLHQPLLT
ncbi:MAG: EAL domain-containing protein [Thiobacillus sp.]|jgi:EAL domain-containing protein (putative c-di-GMP-specific phosphodiesterase class I)|nr:EAL domain-containing protein [Thiobacillus sp.]